MFGPPTGDGAAWQRWAARFNADNCAATGHQKVRQRHGVAMCCCEWERAS